jgi:c-di-GMP-binding flagellar brake protein YcgR
LRGAILRFERRRYVRRVLRQKAFAVLKDYNHEVENFKVGSIMDISQGGLALEYIGAEDTPRKHSLLDFFSLGNEMHPQDVDCEVVYDSGIYIPHIVDELASILITRRCGIRFVELSKAEREQIRFLIESIAY